MANLQSRALILLSDGKIYIDISEKGLKLVVPDEMNEGFSILMDMVNPDKVKRMSIKGEKLQKLNHFFELCSLDLCGVETDEETINFIGTGTKQLAQFMKSCVGYDIKEPDLF